MRISNPLFSLAAITAATVLSASHSAEAQPFGGFAPGAFFATDSSPREVALGDLDGDGNLDVVVANLGPGNVGVLLGNGDGTFAPQVTYMTSLFPQSVALGDLDGDGHLDIAVTTGFNDSVGVLLGNGDGSFGPEMSFNAINAPESMALGDLDGDDDLDIVVPNSSNDIVSVLVGNGDGTFAAPLTFAVGDAPQSVALDDLDNDGDLDMTVANSQSDNVSVLLNNGDGKFAAQTTFATSDGPWSVALGDLDGDGDSDLAVAHLSASLSGSDVCVLLNNGDATFASHMTIASVSRSTDVRLSDLDGDKDLDVIVTDFGGFNAHVILNNADGTFAPQMSFFVGDSPWAVAIGDLDGNSSPDLVMTNSGDDNIAVFLNLTPTDGLPPSAFDLLTPADESEGLPTPESLTLWPGGEGTAVLEWSDAVSTFVDYTITIAHDAALMSIVHQETGLSESRFEIPTGVLDQGATYYWGVTAMNKDGNTLSTPASFQFTTAFTTGPTPDLNGDGVINGADLANLLANWGLVP